MGFLTRFAVCIGIVYWFAPEPAGYRAGYEMRQERERAADVLAALTGLSTRDGASRDEVEALAVEAGRMLAALDPETRKALIDRYFGAGGGNLSALKGMIN